MDTKAREGVRSSGEWEGDKRAWVELSGVGVADGHKPDVEELSLSLTMVQARG